MKKVFIFLCKKSLTLLLCLFAICSASCGGDSPEAPSEYSRQLAQNALSAWDIGLEINKTSLTRNTVNGRGYNPANWITVSSNMEGSCRRTLGLIARTNEYDEDGSASLCELLATEQFRGLTIIREKKDTGGILDTTVVVSKEAINRPLIQYLDESTTNTFYEERQEELTLPYVFVHEIGHALGLQHWGFEQAPQGALEQEVNSYESTRHVMYYTVISGHQYDSAGRLKTWLTENNVIVEPPCEDEQAEECNSTNRGNTVHITTTPTPHPKEIEAVKAVYTRGQASNDPATLANHDKCLTLKDNPADRTSNIHNRPPTPEEEASVKAYESYYPCYYLQSEYFPDTKRSYHASFPEFYISGAIGSIDGVRGSAYGLEGMAEPGPVVDEDNITVRIQFLMSNGSERVIHRPFRLKK